MTTSTLLVDRHQLDNATLHTAEDTPLAEGQVRVRVDSFALTANNITYAAFGDAMSYWRFFPTAQEGRGIIPVWGFGTVVQSLHPGVAVGERLYGYWPMASGAVLQPDKLTAAGFRDATPHRDGLPAVYNQYVRTSTDPFHAAGTEDVQALLRPLFVTSWLIDDFLADSACFGATTVLLSSASSKTAYGTAFLLAQRPGLRVVGLTSAANRGFCESLGCYHEVLAYEELERLAADTPCVYVDFAGNVELRRRIHERFPDLRFSLAVGGTHVEHLGGAKGLPGPKVTLFFAPDRVKKRQADWGLERLGQKLVESWHAFLARVSDPARPWLEVQRHEGADAALAAYRQVLGGRGDPRAGHIVTLR